MAKCKDCTHYLTCRQGNSNPEYCGQFMDYKNTVEVVRCKDCKHRMYSDFEGCYVCHHGGFNAINPDHFCSYGERKGDGNA